MRTKPIQRGQNQIPVNIYKDDVLVKEAASIQEAERWLKEVTGDSAKRSTAITKGIWFYEPYHYKGHIYQFETDPNAVRNYFETINRKIVSDLILT